VRQVGQLPRIM